VFGQPSAYAAAKLMLADDGHPKPTAYNKVIKILFLKLKTTILSLGGIRSQDPQALFLKVSHPAVEVFIFSTLLM
jgi:hypothetical protein